MLDPIAHIRSDYGEKFAVPRQSGLSDAAHATLVFTPTFRDPNALRGLEQCSHLWVIFHFNKNRPTASEDWSPTVRPPRLGGNQRLGVFATRSPFRPNPLGLSVGKIETIETDTPDGPVIHLSGLDLVDGTPVIDIKPYVPYCDSIPEASNPLFGSAPQRLAQPFIVAPKAQPILQSDARLTALVEQTLRLDPRPAYQDDPQREYGVSLGGYNIRFTITDAAITVTGASKA
ncbi:tRNA (N6-threonylcarbamoyladenosine(37)-N6)-methyltransferase TrmO [Sulfuriroseicoccus oceanibius]|uniref:tRNA (N6-threonylcarbamoyladenosine(37)-N6)-methyltransferase TrmO n=1 Tax=Sulfuriroseicoccus oceanibius TaxID=2707525 RepID=A0A6B3L6V5_9BACT|nr:tRNA (N6-threonylcarbamoyladenosine(37)-N6)-methyltransferase TrmO [Sulfuriroseicoccus oceanibius]QQL45005.1 tRNA (N6-threonylcarbamoyladenosine(37)-N6)-methyltransferase TrmO [Sulfuriroseicoccus oceanibius]